MWAFIFLIVLFGCWLAGQTISDHMTFEVPNWCYATKFPTFPCVSFLDKTAETSGASGDDSNGDIDDSTDSGEDDGRIESGEDRDQIADAPHDAMLSDSEVQEALKASNKSHDSKHKQTVIDGRGDDASVVFQSSSESSDVDKPVKQSSKTGIDDPAQSVGSSAADGIHKLGDTKHATQNIDGPVESSSPKVGNAKQAGKATDSAIDPKEHVKQASVTDDNQEGLNQPAGAQNQPDETTKASTTIDGQSKPSDMQETPDEPTGTSSPATESQAQVSEPANEAGNGDEANVPSSLAGVGQKELSQTLEPPSPAAIDQSTPQSPLMQAETEKQSQSQTAYEPVFNGPDFNNKGNQAFANGTK